MLKFAVVLYKRSDLSVEQFLKYYREIHGPMAERLPGLRKYVQNYVVADPKRQPPGWQIIAELYFHDWETMEKAWASPAGITATADLEAFADLRRTTWAVVEEAVIIE